MRFRVFKTNVYISFLFVAFFGLLLIFDKTGLFMPAAISAGIHEAGHIFAMAALKNKPSEINISPGSFEIVRSCCRSLSGQAVIQFAGPFFNIVFFGIFYVFYKIFKIEALIVFSFCNLCYALFNLIPSKGLDGGDILYIMLLKKHSPNFSAVVLDIITGAFAAAALFLLVNSMLSSKIDYRFLILLIYFSVALISGNQNA